MLSIKRAGELLGEDGDDLSNTDIKELLERCTAAARCLLADLEEKERGIEAETDYEFEERAAIREYDGRQSRMVAEVEALWDVNRNHRER